MVSGVFVAMGGSVVIAAGGGVASKDWEQPKSRRLVMVNANNIFAGVFFAQDVKNITMVEFRFHIR